MNASPLVYFLSLLSIASFGYGDPRINEHCMEDGQCYVSPHPDDRTGQQVTERVWIGNFLAAQNKEWLEQEGITHIVSLIGEPAEGRLEGFIYLVLDLEDNEQQEDMQNHILRVNMWIERSIENPGWKKSGVDGRKCVTKVEPRFLVHCAAGVSRSATMVLGHMMLSDSYIKDRVDLDAYLSLLREKRSVVKPNERFMRELRELERRINEREAIIIKSQF